MSCDRSKLRGRRFPSSSLLIKLAENPRETEFRDFSLINCSATKRPNLMKFGVQPSNIIYFLVPENCKTVIKWEKVDVDIFWFYVLCYKGVWGTSIATNCKEGIADLEKFFIHHCMISGIFLSVVRPSLASSAALAKIQSQTAYLKPLKESWNIEIFAGRRFTLMCFGLGFWSTMKR